MSLLASIAAASRVVRGKKRGNEKTEADTKKRSRGRSSSRSRKRARGSGSVLMDLNASSSMDKENEDPPSRPRKQKKGSVLMDLKASFPAGKKNENPSSHPRKRTRGSSSALMDLNASSSMDKENKNASSVKSIPFSISEKKLKENRKYMQQRLNRNARKPARRRDLGGILGSLGQAVLIPLEPQERAKLRDVKDSLSMLEDLNVGELSRGTKKDLGLKAKTCSKEQRQTKEKPKASQRAEKRRCERTELKVTRASVSRTEVGNDSLNFIDLTNETNDEKKAAKVFTKAPSGKLKNGPTKAKQVKHTKAAKQKREKKKRRGRVDANSSSCSLLLFGASRNTNKAIHDENRLRSSKSTSRSDSGYDTSTLTECTAIEATDAKENAKESNIAGLLVLETDTQTNIKEDGTISHDSTPEIDTPAQSDRQSISPIFSRLSCADEELPPISTVEDVCEILSSESPAEPETIEMMIDLTCDTSNDGCSSVPEISSIESRGPAFSDPIGESQCESIQPSLSAPVPEHSVEMISTKTKETRNGDMNVSGCTLTTMTAPSVMDSAYVTTADGITNDGISSTSEAAHTKLGKSDSLDLPPSNNASQDVIIKSSFSTSTAVKAYPNKRRKKRNTNLNAGDNTLPALTAPTALALSVDKSTDAIMRDHKPQLRASITEVSGGSTDMAATRSHADDSSIVLMENPARPKRARRKRQCHTDLNSSGCSLSLLATSNIDTTGETEPETASENQAECNNAFAPGARPNGGEIEKSSVNETGDPSGFNDISGHPVQDPDGSAILSISICTDCDTPVHANKRRPSRKRKRKSHVIGLATPFEPADEPWEPTPRQPPQTATKRLQATPGCYALEVECIKPEAFQRKPVPAKRQGRKQTGKSKCARRNKTDVADDGDYEVESPTEPTLSKSQKEWTVDEVVSLRAAHRKVDPKSATFWEDMANHVGGRDAYECREKWFSLVETPVRRTKKAKKAVATPVANREEDDVFDSTPMRLLFESSNGDDGNSLVDYSLDALEAMNLGSPIQVERLKPKTVRPTWFDPRQRVGHKTFMKRLKRDMKRPDERPPKPSRRKKPVKERIKVGDVEVVGQLSPGGTLHMKTIVDPDDYQTFADDPDEDDECD